MLWILVAVVVGVWLLIKAVPALKQKKLDDTVREVAKPRLIETSGKVATFLRDTYPYIPFSLPDHDVIVARTHSYSNLTGTRNNWLLSSFSPVVEKAISDYLNKSWRPTPSQATVPSSGLQEFWIKEPEHRNTHNGADPLDWQTRRLVVHLRDGGRCRRCGLLLGLPECHIHHITRRSKGGSHAIENLITLCKDCHCLMDGHEHMRAMRSYWISQSGTIHVNNCRNRGSKGRSVVSSVPRLVESGLRPCRRCDPWQHHRSTLRNWKPTIHRRLMDFVEKEFESHWDVNWKG